MHLPYSFLPIRLMGVVLLLFLSRLAPAQTTGWQWATATQNTDPVALAHDVPVAVDAAGNVLICGSFRGSMSCGSITITSTPGSYDLFVAKLSPTGQWLWAVAAGGYKEDAATSIAVDASGDVYVAGLINSQVGAPASSYSPDTATFGALQFINANDSGNRTDADAFVAKLSGAAGQWRWVLGTRPTPSGSPALFVGGAHSLAVQGSRLWAAVSGVGRSAGIGLISLGSGHHVVEIDTSGAVLNASLLSNALDFPPFRLTASPTGKVVVSGPLPHHPVMIGSWAVSGGGFVAQLNGQNSWEWAVGASASTRFQYFSGPALDAAGRVYVTGGLIGTGQFGSHQVIGPTTIYSAFVAALSPTGAWEWATLANGQSVGSSTRVDAAGNLYVTGGYDHTVTLGTTTLPGRGGFFIGRLAPGGQWLGAAAAHAPQSGTYSGSDLALTPTGQAVLTAGFGGTLSFGSITFNVTPGLGSYFVAQLNGPLGFPKDLVAAPAFTLYPNPATSEARLTFSGSSCEQQSIQLTDALGRVVRTLPARRGEGTGVDLRGLAPGVYVVRCGNAVQRLVVE